jgi:hypothetical protein
MTSRLAFLAGALAACSPAVTDGEYAISGAANYALSDSGGHGKFIVLRESGELSKIVVSARVMSLRVEANHILVAHRPLRLTKDSKGILTTSLESACEFLSIDTATNEIRPLSEPVVGLSCAENQWLARDPQ